MKMAKRTIRETIDTADVSGVLLLKLQAHTTGADRTL